jgi:hypothetical protein
LRTAACKGAPMASTTILIIILVVMIFLGGVRYRWSRWF